MRGHPAIRALRSAPVRIRHRARLHWQYTVKRAIAGIPGSGRLPWSIWCRLSAWSADCIIEELALRTGRPLTFLQIGSNDGVTNDPIFSVARDHGWNGVVVEPLPNLYSQLVQNYEGLPCVSPVNAAVGTSDGRTTIFAVEPRPGDPPWVVQIASLDREVVMRHSYALPDLANRIIEVVVPSLRLSTLVGRQGLDRIDVLHVDAEGLDDVIVGQVEPHARWAPTFILFERKHLSADRYRRLRHRLRSSGYRMVGGWPDQLAYRSSPRSRRAQAA